MYCKLIIVLLCCAALPTLAGELEITFPSTVDGSTQQAIVYLPEAAKGAGALPLLVVAHCYGADRHFGGNLGYHQEAEKRGWLVVTPELHGHKAPGAGSFAALEAQHDVLDAIAYMKAHYHVDPARVYLVGRSMGGMLGMLLAAKHPDLFAGVVAGQGISDLKAWVAESPQFRAPVEQECGAYAPATAFDYARRSALNYAPNLQYVPLIMWHGTNDTWVPPTQSEALYTAVARLNRFQEPVHWLAGAPHCPLNYPPAWECDQLQYLVNGCEGGMNLPTRFYPHLTLVTDEAGPLFWLTPTPRTPGQFAQITADIHDTLLTVTAQHVAQLTIDTALLPPGTTIARCKVRTDAPLALRLVNGNKELFNTTVDQTGEATIEVKTK